jgi:spore maturation protein CgeB/GT2 family glycosyltransferase
MPRIANASLTKQFLWRVFELPAARFDGWLQSEIMPDVISFECFNGPAGDQRLINSRPGRISTHMQILVFGMHRSGTSIVARLLNMMGAYFAPEGVEMPAHSTNPKGFWERKDVNELCIGLLRSADCEWYRISSFSIDKIPSEALEEFREKARQIILRLDAHRPWFLKEPRLCVMAPLWLELLEAPVCLFVHRAPLEVARSIEMRDGFPLLFGLALWERYMTAALNDTRGRVRLEVGHADLMADPVGTVRRLAQDLDQLGVHGLRLPSDQEILAFIDPSLHRANEKEFADGIELSPSQKKLAKALRTGAALMATKPIASSDSTRAVLSMYEETIDSRKKITALEKHQAALQERHATVQERHATLSAELAAAGAQLRKQSAKVQLLTRQKAEEGTKVAHLTERNRILKQALDTIEQNFRQLTESKTFHFVVYSARKLGLVSRKPRRCVEAIKNQFRTARKAIKIAKERVRANFEPPPESKQKPEDARFRDKISEALSLRIVASAKNALPLPPRPAPGKVSICFIVLHHSGEQHLRNLFSSFLRVNTLNSVEFRLVLHACTDGSREVVGSFQSRLPIKVTDCDDNQSFACSNNQAAEATSAEYLVFLNNDIVFQDNVVPELLRSLQDRRNGVAGVRLVFPPDRLINASALQHGGIKFRPDPQFFFYRPFNLGLQDFIPDTPRVLEKFPAVTAALAMCRRSDFLAVGGFCEKYLYGYEDVDLCLLFRRLLGLRSVSVNHVACIHDESATRRLNKTEGLRRRRLNNIDYLVRRHGWYLRREILAHKMAGKLFFSDQPLTAAFAVTESTPAAAAGDFFAASELAAACRNEFGWKIRYLSRQNEWYDLEGVDVLVVLIDSYEPSKIRQTKPDLVKVAWMRNWFERWASRPDFDHYDLYFCSSTKSARWLREAHRKPAWVFPLATNPHSFAQHRPDSSLSSDYCFTGSYWRTEREIETAVQPQKLEGYKFAVFGKGWETHPTFGAYAKGFRPYSEMPVVYSSTRVVVDDANSVTKEWGSVNSRVFDALVAGALVITNGAVGSAEIFDGELPTYRSPDELQSLLNRYLGDEKQRRRLVARLQERVLARHTYRHRARTLKRILIERARRGYRVAFKIGAPSRREAPHWGDYHFARSLGRCFAAKGHSFRIDCLDEWERPECFGDDIVIVLRGLSRYHPKPGQINLIWNISHPDKIEDDEYEEFDHVFVASSRHAAEIAQRLPTPVDALLQCTDPEIFFPDPNPDVSAEKLLFVGNSRKQYREVVRLAVEAGMPLGVYGTHWPMFIPANYIRGEYVDNTILRQHYSRCEILLNDHWPSMRERGFISNRLFDGAASGAFIISDSVEDGGEVFGDDLVTYRGQSDFRDQVQYYLSHPEERRVRAKRLRARVLSAHTFACRADVLLTRIKEIDRRKRGIEELTVHPPEDPVAQATVAAKI